MRTVKTALIGAGFVGPHHIEAARRLGFVDVVAVAGSSQKSAEAKASQLCIPKAYGSYEKLLDDPEIEVVHNCTPNDLHLPVTMAAIERGKHVIADKPLALNARDAASMLAAARKKAIVHAVTFNYRYNPLVQQARLMVSRGDLGQVHFVHGAYLQDWLLYSNDYSWRLEKEGGDSRAVADIGSHWCDLTGYVLGSRISEVFAEYTTVFPERQKPKGSREAFASASAQESYENYTVETEDFASVLLRFENGARGTFSVSQVSAGHKNGLVLELNGRDASIRWKQERPNEMWIGRRREPNGTLLKDPSCSILQSGIMRHCPEDTAKRGLTPSATSCATSTHSFLKGIQSKPIARKLISLRLRMASSLIGLSMQSLEALNPAEPGQRSRGMREAPCPFSNRGSILFVICHLSFVIFYLKTDLGLD